MSASMHLARLVGDGGILGQGLDKSFRSKTIYREERWIGLYYMLSRDYNTVIKGFAAM